MKLYECRDYRGFKIQQPPKKMLSIRLVAHEQEKIKE